MTIVVGITQRVVENDGYCERRDVLAQDWAPFLEHIDIAYVPLPNSLETTQRLLNVLPISGLILSGGNDIGEASERDALEFHILEHAIKQKLPVVGVCRGMQMMHRYAGGAFEKIGGHIRTRHHLTCNGQEMEVNSFHTIGFKREAEGFEVLARSDDNVIEAVQHRTHNWHGIMWHPERESTPQRYDLDLFGKAFKE